MDRSMQPLQDQIPDPAPAELEADDYDIEETDEALDLDSALSPEERHRMIREAAYYRAQDRGFEGELELDDWLQAEAEIQARLASE